MGAHNSHRAVGIGWNEWSASIGTRGRHPLERVVDFSGIRTELPMMKFANRAHLYLESQKYSGAWFETFYYYYYINTWLNE